MAYTLHLEKIRFFYAMGNSPAVNLADHLPHDEKADILLLGCGDARNILFTVFSEGIHLGASPYSLVDNNSKALT